MHHGCSRYEAWAAQCRWVESLKPRHHQMNRNRNHHGCRGHRCELSGHRRELLDLCQKPNLSRNVARTLISTSSLALTTTRLALTSASTALVLAETFALAIALAEALTSAMTSRALTLTAALTSARAVALHDVVWQREQHKRRRRERELRRELEHPCEGEHALRHC